MEVDGKVEKLLEYYRGLADLGKQEPSPTDWKPSKADVSKIVAIHNKGNGIKGVTYDLATKEGDLAFSKQPAYAVSVFPSRSKILKGSSITKEDIEDYAVTNSDLLGKKGVSLGTWYDEEKGETYLDCVIKVVNHRLPVVMGMAKALGIVSRQLAVFDLQVMDEFSLPKNLQSDRAMAIDRSKQAELILPVTKVETWARQPSKYDILGVDTPKRRRAKAKKPKRSRKSHTPAGIISPRF